MPLLEAKALGLTYQRAGHAPFPALEGVSFQLEPGEISVILGPSGCGKSSLLSLISGLRRPTAGEILYKGMPVTEPSRERVIIFQDYALFPWKTAWENIAFALRSRNVRGESLRKEALQWLESMQLETASHLYPAQLSGGMQQRVGIARALAADPEILLLDEPFASLDVAVKRHVLRQLLDQAKRLKKAMIFVTHSIEEALFVGQKIHVMSTGPGRIIRTLTPDFAKPEQLWQIKHMPEFRELERELYDLLGAERW